MFCPHPPSHTRKSLLLACETLLKICEITIGDLAIGDLANGCLGVDAIESLDVRVATNFVKMMRRKKIARNRSSNFDSSILILRAMLRRMVLASFSRSLE